MQITNITVGRLHCLTRRQCSDTVGRQQSIQPINTHSNYTPGDLLWRTRTKPVNSEKRHLNKNVNARLCTAQQHAVTYRYTQYRTYTQDAPVYHMYINEYMSWCREKKVHRWFYVPLDTE